MPNQVSISKAPESKNWVISGTISKIGETKTGEKNGNSWAMCNVTILDDSGEGQITLWNEEIQQIQLGKKYSIQGYTREYEGKKSLAVGKYGKIELLGDQDASQTTIDETPSTANVTTTQSQKITNELIYEKQQLILDSISGIFRLMVDLQLAKKEDIPSEL